MRLYYTVLFVALDIATCYKSQKKLSLNRQLASSNIEVRPNKDAEEGIPVIYRVNKPTQHDPTVVSNSLHYFPHMEYPANIIETSKPFYFDSAASDLFLYAFSNDVISAYKSTFLQKPKRPQNSQSNHSSIIKLTDEIKSICKDIIAAKEKKVFETEDYYFNNTIVNNTNLVHAQHIINSISESIQIYYENNLDNIDKSVECIQKYNESNVDVMGNTPESVQQQNNSNIENSIINNLNLTNNGLDWLAKYITKNLLIDWYEDYSGEEADTISEEVCIEGVTNVLTLLDLLTDKRSLIKNNTSEDCEECSQDLMHSIESDSIFIKPPYNISELITISDISNSEPVLMKSTKRQSDSCAINLHPLIIVPHIQPQFRSKYKNQILQRETTL